MLKESSSNDATSISLRTVVPEDEPFLLRVYSSTRADEMALVPWNDAQREAFVRMQFNAQQHHYQSHFPGALHQIIEQSGQPVGRLYVLRADDAIRILDITVLPEFRNAGIGTRLLKDLINEASVAGKPLQIHVENYNPSLRLFARLGFRQVEESGFHLLMQWNGDDDREGRSPESESNPQ